MRVDGQDLLERVHGLAVFAILPQTHGLLHQRSDLALAVFTYELLAFPLLVRDLGPLTAHGVFIEPTLLVADPIGQRLVLAQQAFILDERAGILTAGLDDLTGPQQDLTGLVISVVQHVFANLSLGLSVAGHGATPVDLGLTLQLPNQ